ncbi:hypothetical protein LCGC14_3013400 [marine sediment metagenome]|uniref:Uncharacterized protein n=1 Tax=marine sediment metagenome TaxID=412755 RepID=A0A0F8XKD1_9ZZZZ
MTEFQTIWIHTLDGRAAAFDGNQVCFTNMYGRGFEPAYSLAQIKKEQRDTCRYRQMKGWNGPSKMSHRRYRVCVSLRLAQK